MSESGTGNRRVFSVDLPSGTERQVGVFTNGAQSPPGLSISPDGSSLVLQVWDASPDGAKVVFAYRPVQRTELWALENVAAALNSTR